MTKPPSRKPKSYEGLLERLSNTEVPPVVAFIDMIGSISAISLLIAYISNGGHLG